MNYKDIFEDMISGLSTKNGYDISLIRKAFLFAEKLHSGQKRKTGEEYITHPVEVALTLAEMGFDTNLICAGLLHDTVEDCGYTLEEMSKDFNPLISQIVDAVTEIKLNADQKSELDFPKEEEEIKTYHKLMSIGKANKFAFYIKFADRINNLRTIECFKYYKQIEKVKQTERWLLPIIKLLKASKFYYQIKNECFKITNREILANFCDVYKIYKNQNLKNFKFVIDELYNVFSNESLKNKKPKIEKILYDDLTEWEICESFPNNMDIKNITLSRIHLFNKVPTKKIFIIFKDNLEKNEIIKGFFDTTQNIKLNKTIKLIGYGKDNIFDNEYFVLQDSIRNKYQTYIFTEKEYIEFMNGSSDGVEISNLDEEEDNNLSSKYIKVYTRSGEEMILPEGSTVLDFAFKLHKELGFGCKYAHINTSPTKSPVYTHLSNGDQVNLIVEKDENTGVTKNVARLRWLTYVRSEYARKILTKYFESLYE